MALKVPCGGAPLRPRLLVSVKVSLVAGGVDDAINNKVVEISYID